MTDKEKVEELREEAEEQTKNYGKEIFIYKEGERE